MDEVREEEFIKFKQEKIGSESLLKHQKEWLGKKLVSNYFGARNNIVMVAWRPYQRVCWKIPFTKVLYAIEEWKVQHLYLRTYLQNQTNIR